MSFENWIVCQRESWNVSMSEATQKLSIMKQAENKNLKFSYLEEEIVRHINKYEC